jgi:hypothetical protein
MRKVLCAALVVSLSACGSRATLHVASDGGAATDAREGRRACTFKGFAPAVSYAITNEPRSTVAIDRTGNGHLDLLVGEVGSVGPKSELLANVGNGRFVLSASYGASDNNIGNLVAADFNGDGKIDLASQSSGSDSLVVGPSGGLLGIDFGTGKGTFASQLSTYGTQQTYGLLAAGDFNGDGRLDLAFAGYDYIESGGFITPDGRSALPAPEPADFALNVLFNAGGGTFATATTYANPYWFTEIATGDFNGDGHPDIVELTSTTPGGFGVFLNAGDGTFGSEVLYVASPDWTPYGLAVADFNGDGRDDVATTTIQNPNAAATETSVLEVFTGAGDGTLSGPVSYTIANIPSGYQIVTGDFNGDGKPDLAMVIGQDSQGALIEPVPVAVFENLGDGSFAAPVTYTVGGADLEYAMAIAAGDFNGDGVADIAVATMGEVSPYPVAVNVLLSNCE